MREQIYTPGAGHMPPELAGRDDLIDSWNVMLSAVRSRGRAASSDVVLTGLRGIGKSVLLSRLSETAERGGYGVVRLQGNPSTSMIEALIQRAGARAESEKGAWAKAREQLAALKSVSVSVAGTGLSLERDPNRAHEGGAHPEAIAQVLADLATGLNENKPGGLIVGVDEFQMTRPDDVRLLGAVLNQLNTVHPQAPLIFLAAGLPNTRSRMVGPDRDDPYISNPERLFTFRPLPSHLTQVQAANALIKPAERHGVHWDSDALDAIYEASGGYPAHLQTHAAYAWIVGDGREAVTLDHVHRGAPAATRSIGTQYLEPRWRDMSDHYRAYVTAVALCGGEGSSGQVAAVLGSTSPAQAKRRDGLIGRGEIFDPEYGRVQLSMPAMREFALVRYPETVDRSESTLPTPQDMMANLEDWKEAQQANRAATVGFPQDVITGQRPSLPPTKAHQPIEQRGDDRGR